MLSFPPLLCRKKYQAWIEEINTTAKGKVGPYTTQHELYTRPVRIPCADIYDVDNEHSYIMDKALRSYKLYRDKEKAESRQQQIRSAYRRRWKAPIVPSKLKMAGPPRPKTAMSHTDAIREVDVANSEDRLPKKHVPAPLELSRINLSMGDSPKTQNYMRRNRTTHAWQSHSFPSASYLHHYAKMQMQQIAQSRVEPIQPAGKSTGNNRPQSAYAYDGSFFTPKGPKNEYFVIHPDWVSEAMTIQKLSLTNRRPNSVMTQSDTWPGRRCKSAPPQNRRNVITWDTEADNV